MFDETWTILKAGEPVFITHRKSEVSHWLDDKNLSMFTVEYTIKKPVTKIMSAESFMEPTSEIEAQDD